MILPVLTLIAVLWQQPARPPARSTQRAAAFDTTGAVVRAIGDRVADVKSALDLFRRAVFNGTDAELLSAAAMFGARCHSLDSAAVLAPRKICRSCAAPRVNAALGGYREVMPEVARTGARCASRLRQLASGREGAKRLRGDVHNIGNAIVAGFVPYERQVRALREAIGAIPARR